MARTTSNVVRLKNVYKIYEMGDSKVKALNGVSLDIKKGEFRALMGASGSGKSTALNMIGALDAPTRGKIYLSGKDISLFNESQLAQLRGKTIGFIFQTFNLIPTLTAIENVMLPMTFQGVPEQEKRKRAKELLESLDMEARINHKPSELSGGQRQRIAIARALANDPDLILADEPTGNLDSKTGQKVMDILIDLHKKEHKTIVIVTHDPYIASYAKEEKVVMLRDGQILKDHRNMKRFVWSRKVE